MDRDSRTTLVHEGSIKERPFSNDPGAVSSVEIDMEERKIKEERNSDVEEGALDEENVSLTEPMIVEENMNEGSVKKEMFSDDQEAASSGEINITEKVIKERRISDNEGILDEKIVSPAESMIENMNEGNADCNVKVEMGEKATDMERILDDEEGALDEGKANISESIKVEYPLDNYQYNNRADFGIPSPKPELSVANQETMFEPVFLVMPKIEMEDEEVNDNGSTPSDSRFGQTSKSAHSVKGERPTRRCCFVGCSGNNLTSKLYTFPRTSDDAEIGRCLLWRERSKNASLFDLHLEELRGRYHVCGKHFNRDQFCKPGSDVLKKAAVPEDNDAVPEVSEVVTFLSELAGPSGCSNYPDCDVDPLAKKTGPKKLCCAVGCSGSNLNSSMYTFPRIRANNNSQEERCKVWLTFAANSKLSQVPLKDLHKKFYLCSKHFSRHQFGLTQLKNTAVPDVLESLNIESAIHTESLAAKKDTLEVVHNVNPEENIPAQEVSHDENVLDREENLLSNNSEEQATEEADSASAPMRGRKRSTPKQKCCAPMCSNTDLTSTMHTFPSILSTDKNGQVVTKRDALERCKIWVQNTGNSKLAMVNPSDLHKHFFLCALHFGKDCYGPRGSLKSTAVPSLFPLPPRSESEYQTYHENVSKTLVKRDPKHTRVKRSQCNGGEKSFSKNELLNAHPGILTGEQPLQIDVSEKEFSTSNNFISHRKTQAGEKPFECNYCAQRFSRRYYLKVHLRTHTGEKPFQCDQCQQKFSQKSNLKVHKRIHTGEKPFQCDECDQMFLTKYFLKRHVKMHSGENPFQCDHCEKTFTRRKALIIHQMAHTGGKPFQCKECERRFSKNYQLKRHLRRHSGEKPFQCDSCEMKFVDSGSLYVHRKKHKEKPFQCEECERRFSMKYELKNHLKTHTGEKPFQCDDCKRSFLRKSALNIHQKIHTGEKPFQCDECERRFRRMKDLKIHKKKHSGEKPFHCNECDKRFLQNRDLKMHQRTHTGERLFHCDECGKKFSNSTNLIAHRRTHTGEKPFQCDECGQRFSQNSNLKKHLQIHSGERPYQCEVCKKTFSNSGYLITHRKLHTGEKPFQCQECERRFSLKSDLKKHKKTHTGERPFQCYDCERSFLRNSDLKRHQSTHTRDVV